METGIKEIILNGMPFGKFAALLLCSLAGVLVLFMKQIYNSVKKDKDTPDKFNFVYLLKTSGARMVIGLIVICFSIAYFGDMSKLIFGIAVPLEINGFVALLLGISIDAVIKGILDYGKDSSKFLINKMNGK
jgi:hypothetical protein